MSQKWSFLNIWPEWQFCNIQRRYLIYCSNELEFNGRKSYNKKTSTFPKYEDLWWKGGMAFLLLEGESHKGNYDIYLRDFGGEGGNGFGKRLSWYQGNHHIYMGAYSRQGTIACRVG